MPQSVGVSRDRMITKVDETREVIKPESGE